jgi:hypothetical protein
MNQAARSNVALEIGQYAPIFFGHSCKLPVAAYPRDVARTIFVDKNSTAIDAERDVTRASVFPIL